MADTAIGAVVTTTASAIGNGLFYADTALSIADARYTCQTGGVAGCAVSVARIGAGVAGYGFAAGAKALSKLSEGAGSAVGRWAYRQASRGLNVGAWLQNIASLGYSIAGGCNMSAAGDRNRLGS